MSSTSHDKFKYVPKYTGSYRYLISFVILFFIRDLKGTSRAFYRVPLSQFATSFAASPLNRVMER